MYMMRFTLLVFFSVTLYAGKPFPPEMLTLCQAMQRSACNQMKQELAPEPKHMYEDNNYVERQEKELQEMLALLQKIKNQQNDLFRFTICEPLATCCNKLNISQESLYWCLSLGIIITPPAISLACLCAGNEACLRTPPLALVCGGIICMCCTECNLLPGQHRLKYLGKLKRKCNELINHDQKTYQAKSE